MRTKGFTLNNIINSLQSTESKIKPGKEKVISYNATSINKGRKYYEIL